MTTKAPGHLAQAILEMARDLRQVGVMDEPTHAKITVRHLGCLSVPAAEPIAGTEIRALREQAQLSQAAFARYLNLTTGYVSQLERGVKTPKGPVLALLNILRRNGVEVIR
jgi:putative transcriptional regulator